LPSPPTSARAPTTCSCRKRSRVELAFLDRPYAAGFERPYGWAWLLALHAEAERHDAPWAAALEPLALAFAARFHAFLPKLTYPLRVGTHFNISFALFLARHWAETRDPVARHPDRRAGPRLVRRRPRLSGMGTRRRRISLVGADRSASDGSRPRRRLHRLVRRLPSPRRVAPARDALHPATVSDRSDGKIAHLDGLNLSRAWCWRAIAARSAPRIAWRPGRRRAAQRHLDAALPHVTGDYMGEHWLASFALLALDGLVIPGLTRDPPVLRGKAGPGSSPGRRLRKVALSSD
jgi:hypothetical protein